MNDPHNPFYERARVVQIFMGKADFFFCNWHAESEQTILDKLDWLGAWDFVITVAVKMKHPMGEQKIQQMLIALKKTLLVFKSYKLYFGLYFLTKFH